MGTRERRGAGWLALATLAAAGGCHRPLDLLPPIDAAAAGDRAVVVQADAPAGTDAATAPDATGDAATAAEASVADVAPAVDDGPATASPDATCGTTTVAARRLPVNLLIVLDRSGSMQENGKWTAAVRGLRSLLARLDDSVRVGITMFPALPTAGAADEVATYGTPNIPLEALGASRARIGSLLDGASPNGNTPMVCAAEGTRTYLTTSALDGSRNVVLITDGSPTVECSGAPMCSISPPDYPCLLRQGNAATDAVRVSVARGARGTPAIRYFIAGTPDASDAFLSDLAFTGNAPREAGCQATSSCHYRLETSTFEADLTRALDDIRARATSCDFAVDVDPARVDFTRVAVGVTFATGAPLTVARDVGHADGWDYAAGMRSVVFYGPACDRVRADSAAQVRIVFGCS